MKDRSGNATAQATTLTFDLLDAPPGSAVWISDADGAWGNPANWLLGRLPSQDDDVVLQRFGAKPQVTLDTGTVVKSLRTVVPLVSGSRPNLSILRDLNAAEPVEISAGNVTVGGAASFEQTLTLDGGALEVSGRLETRAALRLEKNGALTLSGADAQFAPTGGVRGANFSFTARDGAVIEFPGFGTYDGPGDFTPLFPVGTRFSAQGAGSRLMLPDLTSANGPVDWNARGAPSVQFEAVSGGTLVLAELTALTGRTALVAEGLDSRVEAPRLTTITGPVSAFISSVAARDGGILEVPALTELTHVEATLSERRLFDGTTLAGVLDATALQLADGSILKGVGRVPATLDNRATIRLDTAPGSLVVEGDLTLAPTSVLNATIGLGAARNEAGHLDMQGTLALDGVLELTLANGYLPAADDRFEIAAAHSLTGAFVSLQNLDLPNGLRLRVDVADGNVAVVVVQP